MDRAFSALRAMAPAAGEVAHVGREVGRRWGSRDEEAKIQSERVAQRSTRVVWWRASLGNRHRGKKDEGGGGQKADAAATIASKGTRG